MKSTFFAFASSVLVALASAYTQPVGNPDGNPIYKPGLQEQVPVGSPYTITWDPTTTGTVSILLLRGPGENIKVLYPIAEGIANTGTFSWTPASNLENDVTHYGLQLIVDGTGQYQYSTQFGVSNPGASSVAPTSSVIVISSSTSSVPAVVTSSAISSAISSSATSNSTSIKLQDATTVVHTNLVTVTSCAPTVSNCPGRSTTVAPVVSVPTPVTIKSSTYWSNNTLTTTTTSSSGVASTGFAVSTTALPSQFTGAGDKIRVGCAMGAVMVAALALAL